MDKNEMMTKCREFFSELSELLCNAYEIVGSCNEDLSAYLIPLGTSDQITYTSKPDKSFRISDHWNWYANVNKCTNERYVQCLSVDMPFAKKRKAPGAPSSPWWGCQVAFIGDDGKYHAVYGEIYDKKTKTWLWKETSAKDVIKLLQIDTK